MCSEQTPAGHGRCACSTASPWGVKAEERRGAASAGAAAIRLCPEARKQIKIASREFTQERHQTHTVHRICFRHAHAALILGACSAWGWGVRIRVD